MRVYVHLHLAELQLAEAHQRENRTRRLHALLRYVGDAHGLLYRALPARGVHLPAEVAVLVAVIVVGLEGEALAVLQQEGFGKPVRDFVGVISANRRLRALREIVTAFAELVADRRGIITAHVLSAQPLNDLQRQQLRARLIEAGYGNVNILEQIQPDLLGGLVVRIGARLYDTSLKSRLQRLQYAMKGAA